MKNCTGFSNTSRSFFRDPKNILIILLLSLLSGLAVFSGLLAVKVGNQDAAVLHSLLDNGTLSEIEPTNNSTFPFANDTVTSTALPANNSVKWHPLSSSVQQAQYCLHQAWTETEQQNPHNSSFSPEEFKNLLEKNNAKCLSTAMRPPHNELNEISPEWKNLSLRSQFIINYLITANKNMVKQIEANEVERKKGKEKLSKCEGDLEALEKKRCLKITN